ncbi:hypothetical protein [Streptomyces sp. NPDC002580]|uniref:hypothetical protein n=1 Tax=Streptomyces sp. NPDC002580 TaxID=3364653 RepID=UPI00368F3728
MTAVKFMDAPQVHPHFATIGAAPTIEGPSREHARFLGRFTDEQLAIVWKFGGFAGPFPGRSVMAKFLQPIPGSWRDVLRRAVRTMANRPELAALRALLSAVLREFAAPVPHPVPAPRALSPQERCHRCTPVRGSPERALHMCPVMPGAPPM